MKEFRDKVAVITGAASGIGRGLAERCLSEGMKVVLADIEEAELAATAKALAAGGGELIPVVTDVAKADAVQYLADKTMAAYGAIHLLCNNAGVGAGGLVREHTLADWEWVIGVNLWGVIHGLHVFLPIMLEQNTECHIVNTASVEGLWTRGRGASYQVTKHGVVALSEVLKLELTYEETRVGVSVLCPGGVATRIVESGRNRPAELTNPPESRPEITPEMQTRIDAVKETFANAMPPLEVADHVFRAIRENRFFILTHPELNDRIEKRLQRILNDGVPAPQFTISNAPDTGLGYIFS